MCWYFNITITFMTLLMFTFKKWIGTRTTLHPYQFFVQWIYEYFTFTLYPFQTKICVSSSIHVSYNESNGTHQLITSASFLKWSVCIANQSINLSYNSPCVLLQRMLCYMYPYIYPCILNNLYPQRIQWHYYLSP